MESLMAVEPPGEDFDGQWQGAVELRSMAAEVQALSRPETERVRVRRRPARRLRRMAKGAVYLAAAGALFFGGWVPRPAVDGPATASSQQGDEVSREIMPEKGVTLD